MPQPGLLWRHVIISTYASWLPGDPRGFRSRRPDVHSGGDYKAPPPAGEHAGLHQYSRQHSGKPVRLDQATCKVVLDRIIKRTDELAVRRLAIAVAPTHAHLLVELPADLGAARQLVGQIKAATSHAIRDCHPGTVWARGGKFQVIADFDHQRNTFEYILRQHMAWIWSYRGDTRYND